MLSDARRSLVAELLHSNRAVTITDLQARFDISPMTARRDLRCWRSAAWRGAHMEARCCYPHASTRSRDAFEQHPRPRRPWPKPRMRFIRRAALERGDEREPAPVGVEGPALGRRQVGRPADAMRT